MNYESPNNKQHPMIRRLYVWLLCICTSGIAAATPIADNGSAHLSLKTPGNSARQYAVTFRAAGNGKYISYADKQIPVEITRSVETSDEQTTRITIDIKAVEDVYFNYGEQVETGFDHRTSHFLLPGFWYHQNLRSPKEAPSFHTSDSWLVREDRLSTPLTAIFNAESGQSVSVIRLNPQGEDALTTHKEGEVILSGKSSVGYTGFLNVHGKAVLAYGYPYCEMPRSYIRKLTLAPAIEAFQKLERGESVRLVWEIKRTAARDFSQCVQRTWEYSFDTFRPQPVDTPYSTSYMKEVLSHFFEESYVATQPLHYYSGVELETATCATTGVAEVGFVGRTLLNAFNALEYGEAEGKVRLVADARSIFDSYLQNGFTEAGFFQAKKEYGHPAKEQVHSIRRQSEGAYAVLYYLDYEKRHGRKHPQWEERIRQLAERFLQLQHTDGSFPRKFRDDLSQVDESGGSTPSATLPLVMAYKYFKEKRYLAAAKRSIDYVEREIIAKADYFSSTLDANCEDKEAALAAATAGYYLALVSKGEERSHYAALTRKAAYFGLSWYYTWDVPFAPGQMLGDIGLHSRGWGNVSVENNHIDVFVFEFADVLQWLSTTCAEPRFQAFAEVISTSMRQLLPYEGHLCGIAKTGFYPEVVQHTTWDYGRNGKGYYNNIFAPGWTVASLWQLLTPGRAERFLTNKK